MCAKVGGVMDRYSLIRRPVRGLGVFRAVEVVTDSYTTG
jgi:hypothetical protein